MQQDTLEWILTTKCSRNEKKRRIWYIHGTLKLLAALSVNCLPERKKEQDIRWLCIISMTYTGSRSSGAVSKNIQCMHENVFEWWKKVRKNYEIVKFNTFLQSDNNSPKD